MGYVESTALFFTAVYMVKVRVLATLLQCEKYPHHPLEVLTLNPSPNSTTEDITNTRQADTAWDYLSLKA